jgi:hypothetical protein
MIKEGGGVFLRFLRRFCFFLSHAAMSVNVCTTASHFPPQGGSEQATILQKTM